MSRLSLNDVEWGEFRLEELFEIKIGQNIDGNKIDKQGGSTPYITRKESNNGLDGFIEAEQEKRNEAFPVITIGNETAEPFVQTYPFFTGTKVNILEPKEKLSESCLKFVATCIRQHKSKYSYSFTANSTRLKKQNILLPLDNSKPNYQFMEDYIKQEQKIIAQKVIDYYKQQILEEGFELVGLTDVEWGEIPLKKLFHFQRGNQNNMASLIPGNTPLVSAKKVDNGYKSFVQKNQKPLFEGNIITLNNDGDGGVGIAYYQPHLMALDTHVTALIPKEARTKSELLFLATVITLQRGKFSHGYSLNNNRIVNQKIMIPMDKNGNPHWEYMSKFMKKIEAVNINKVLSYIYIYELAVRMGREMDTLQDKEWKEFWLEDVVSIHSGVRLTKTDQISGPVPFVGSSDSNNGVTGFISNTNRSLDRNVLGVNYNGSVVENFYHPYFCIFSDDVKRIHWLERANGNKYTYLFLKEMILKQREKYAYGYKFNAGRMARQKIMLPIDRNDKPDYEYMKNYMLIKMIKEQKQVIDYFRDNG